MSADRAGEILARRAEALARPAAPPAPEDGLSLITFDVGDEVCAVESRAVLEVFRPADVAPLPGAEPPVFGVAMWRGELLTVLDLRSAAAAAGAERPAQVVVLGGGGRAVGVLADAARDLVSMPSARIHAPEGSTPGDHVVGVSESGIVVLDAQGLLYSYA